MSLRAQELDFSVEGAFERLQKADQAVEKVDSPSGILNRIQFSKVYKEHFSSMQEDVDRKLILSAIGKLGASQSISMEVDTDPVSDSDDSLSFLSQLSFDEIEAVWEVIEAAQDYATDQSHEGGIPNGDWQAHFDEAVQFFTALKMEEAK